MIIILRVLISLIVAVVLGKLMAKIRLPEILGWLIAGMIVGPYAMNILNDSVMSNTVYQTLLSILECTVGIMIGTELVIKKLKRSGKEIIITTLFQSIGTFVFVSLCFGLIFWFTDLPVYVGVIFGAIALATAPAPALSIVKEFNTKGPVTDTLIPMAALDDIVAIAVFFSVISLIGSTGSLASTLLIMIAAPLLVGSLVGVVAGKIMNKIEDNSQIRLILITFILALSALGIFVNVVILAEPMINFLLVGMAFAAGFSNVVSEEKLEEIMDVAKPMIGASLILMIMNLGAPLNYQLIFGAGLMTVIYIVSRMIGKYGGAYLGAKITNMPVTVKKYLGLTLLPHSGVSLVFTGIAVTTLMPVAPELAVIVQGTIAAAAIINEVIAVILSKKAFEWANEIDANA